MPNAPYELIATKNMSDINKELDSLQRAGEQSSQASWFKFTNVGDSIQGTYLTSYPATSPVGQEQIVYVIKNDEGAWNVARNTKDERVRRVMDMAKPGQIVRFVFSEIIPHKTKGFNAIHAIDVYTRPDLVDEKWLAENATATIETPANEKSLGGELPKEA